jgi:hypothetical protein
MAKIKLLEILNISWTSGRVPQIWREAIMIPLLKPGKDSTQRIRRAHWPSETSLEEKLYGPKYEQKKTALFIQETELLI